jgi:hypothetical protein
MLNQSCFLLYNEATEDYLENEYQLAKEGTWELDL